MKLTRLSPLLLHLFSAGCGLDFYFIDGCQVAYDDVCTEDGEASTWYLDADGDGYGQPEDCQISCQQPEDYVRNSLDCDDEDPGSSAPTTWYLDQDSDGYGDSAQDSQLSCLPPSEDYTATPGDCNDDSPTIHPGAEEICDSVDNDCNGYSDDDDPAEPADTQTWYMDYDGDGYGDPDFVTTSCSQRAHEVSNDDDCDDLNESINPDGIEVCDGADNDCDGVTDRSASLSCLGAAETRYQGTGEDRSAGSAVAIVGDIDRDGHSDFLIGSPSYTPGQAHIVFGDDKLDSGTIDLSGELQLSGETAYSYTGASLSSAGDVDNDGYADFLVGAPEEDTAGELAGAVYLVSGVDVGRSDFVLSSSSALKITGDKSLDRLGLGLSSAKDVDGDGYDDVLIGAPGESGISDERIGHAYLLFGDALSDRGTGSVGDLAAVTIDGSHGEGQVGSALGAGDLTGDGLVDVFVNAPGVSGSNGEVYLFYNSAVRSAGTLTTSDADVTIEPVGTGSSYESLGESVVFVEDFDGDGVGDLLVGAPSTDGSGTYRGAVYLLSGASLATGSVSAAALVLEGERDEDYAGKSLVDAGDIDGDGRSEVLIGAPGDDTDGVDVQRSNSGAVYLVLGTSDSGSLSLAAAWRKLPGEMSGDGAGSRLSLSAGDLDGDGLSEILVGAPGADADGDSDVGLVYLISTAGL